MVEIGAADQGAARLRVRSRTELARGFTVEPGDTANDGEHAANL